MRLISLSTIITFFLVQTCFSQSATLSGQIQAPTGDSVFLQTNVKTSKGFETVILASAKLNDKGEFTLTIKLDSAQLVSFYDGTEITSLFLVPGDNISMTLHAAIFDESITYSGKGGSRNNALASLALAGEINYLMGERLKSDMDTTTLFELMDDYAQKTINAITDYALAFPEMKTHLEKTAKQTETSTKRQKENILSELALEILKKKLVGLPLLDITGVDLNGEALSLSAFKGKTTVVDFWATWCGPCKTEMPYLKKLEEEYGDVNFVSVAVWDKEEAWKEMAKQLGFKNNMFIPRENNEALAQYMLESIPRYMVLDKNLNIVDIDAPRPSSNKLQKLF
ncbi:MAG: TlpA family protein disulfide reductase [Flavobacteriales bacterium]|nr:TlpA family protein disulfide reductase [Flavobacteriales bacterium]